MRAEVQGDLPEDKLPTLTDSQPLSTYLELDWADTNTLIPALSHLNEPSRLATTTPAGAAPLPAHICAAWEHPWVPLHFLPSGFLAIRCLR